jgi:TRAP-type C4-dicarboxylate transport system substrate-binding protein
VRNGKLYMAKLTKLSRADNSKSIETLKKQGITVVDLSSKNAAERYAGMGAKARQILASSKLKDKGFTTDFVNRVESSVLEFRKAHTKRTK